MENKAVYRVETGVERSIDFSFKRVDKATLTGKVRFEQLNRPWMYKGKAFHKVGMATAKPREMMPGILGSKEVS